MIQVLDRALNILILLGKTSKTELSLSEISAATSLDKGTCAHIMKTLQAKGFVQQDAPRGNYKLGYKIYHLIGNPVENEDLTKIARKDIDALGKFLNETVLLAVVNNDKRIVLYNTTPDRNLVIQTSLERDVYSVCAGRVIIAHYKPAHLEKTIIRLGLPTKEEWPEIYQSANPERELVNALTQIKQNGYDILDDRHGIVGFAAPIFKKGHVAGCVGLYLPKERLEDTKMILDSLLRCAQAINKKILLSENC